MDGKGPESKLSWANLTISVGLALMCTGMGVYTIAEGAHGPLGTTVASVSYLGLAGLFAWSALYEVGLSKE